MRISDWSSVVCYADLNRFGDRFRLLCGVDTLALESLLMGADGWVAGLVDAYPRETVALYELAKAERLKEALQLYRWFMLLLRSEARRVGQECVRPFGYSWTPYQ